MMASSVEPLPIAFTAQSKFHFYCRDAICEFVFSCGYVPLNPFRAFGYFLDDRVDRDLVRQANNTLIRRADELWVFGTTIADGVVFEIQFASKLEMPIRYFTVDNRASGIREVGTESINFEPEIYNRPPRRSKDELLRDLLGIASAQLGLFPDDGFGAMDEGWPVDPERDSDTRD